MSAVIGLRPVHSAAPLSPERQRLADTIERMAGAQARVDRIAAAQVKAHELAFARFFEAEAAEAALADARESEPRRLVDSLLGNSPVAGLTVAEAERALAVVQGSRAALTAADTLLAAERLAAEDSFRTASINRNVVLSEVLRGSSGLRALLNDFEDARRRYASLRLALRWLGQLPRNALTELQRGHLDEHVDGWPADPAEILGQWQPAVAALEIDAAAKLPGDGNSEAA